MPTSNANAVWEGSIKDGKGSMHPAHGGEIPFSLGTRFEGKQGSNPEEMIGAALAGCFSMAMSAGLARENLTPKRISTRAAVTIEKQDAGFTITHIKLSTEAEIPGIDAEKFQKLAEDTKKGCPVSKALAAVKIDLEAKLIG